MSETACPAVIELLAAPMAPLIAEHAALCPRCHALRGAIAARVEPPPPSGRRDDSERVPAEAGGVVLIASSASEELLTAIVLGESEDGLTVVPVSPNARHATEWDLILGEQVLGYPAVAQVWNHGLALPEQAIEQVASLPAPVLRDVRSLLRAAIESAAVPEGLEVGAPVLDQGDPRLLHQDEDARHVLAFWEPTLALAGSQTLGQLVRHRREDLNVSAESLEALAGTPNWLAAMEADTLDIPRTLPPGALAAAMRLLGVAASRRLARLARWTIEARAPAGGAALARNQPARGEQDAPDVDAYIEQFIDELGRQ